MSINFYSFPTPGFLAVLRMFLCQLFEMIDTDSSGFIDFDEFIYVLVTYCIFNRVNNCSSLVGIKKPSNAQNSTIPFSSLAMCTHF